MSKKIAIIDLGTNTFHLLIAEGTKAVYKDEITVKLGEGGISKGVINELAMQRGLDTLTHYKGIIDKYKVDSIYAFGTSALRNANNANEFITVVQNRLGITIEVIDGKREAEFIYWGIVASGLLNKEISLIMDIGGGSVEFILGTESKLIWRKSYELGAQRLLDNYVHSDPISKNNQTLLYKYLKSELSDLKVKIDAYKPVQLIGASGTFHTIVHMLKGEKAESPVEVSNMDFEPLLQKILQSTTQERMVIPGIPKGRENMIVPASILVKHVLTLGSFSGFNLSPYSMKEGILASIS